MSSEPSAVPRIKVVVECTTECLPATLVADLRQVIDHHNAGGVDNECIEITPVKCQPPTPVVQGSKISYKCQPVQKLVQCSAHEVTQEETHQC
eukprot:Em0001g1710a